jgi:AraC-like DNA-binding protein
MGHTYAGSPGQQIAKTVAWLKQHYTEVVEVDKLAARAHMSPSTFRHHFRDITGEAHCNTKSGCAFRRHGN